MNNPKVRYHINFAVFFIAVYLRHRAAAEDDSDLLLRR